MVPHHVNFSKTSKATRQHLRNKGRNPKGRVYVVPHSLAKHPNWVRLSPHAKLLWLELGLEYNLLNNGWLACPYKYLLKERGFRSRSTISKCFDELLWYDFIEQTYPGSIKECARYALTHLDINDHREGLVSARKAPHTYKQHDGTPFPKKIRSSSPPDDTEGPPHGPKAGRFTSDKSTTWTKEESEKCGDNPSSSVTYQEFARK